jgi:hypothetical protein
MPRRSVTRFFIPLIDVLTLLFCIFLLMPLVKAPAETGDEGRPGPSEDGRTGQEPKEGPDTLDRMRAELEQLRRDKARVLQERLAVRVLEIDANTGALYYDDRGRVEIRTEADARDLILRDRQAIGEGRELYYEIRYPRAAGSAHPLESEFQNYENWFKEVAHGYDVPGSPLKRNAP